jgi:hypothetical protein
MVSAALLSIALSTISCQTTEADDGLFREWGELHVGIWEGEFQAQEPLPGLLDKGDPITFRTVTKWSQNKKVLVSRTEFQINGVTAGTVMDITGWNPLTKELTRFSLGSLGGFTVAAISKKDDRWVEVRSGVGFADGKRFGGEAMTTYSDDGRTATTVFPGGFSLAGELLPPLTITVKRIDDSMPTAQDYLTFVAPLAGTWHAEVLDADGKMLMKTTSEWKMAPGNMCAMSSEKLEDGTPLAASIHGYNPATRNWQVIRHMADGSGACMDVEIDKKTLAGGPKAGVNYKYTLTEISVDGETSTSWWTAHLTTDNTLELRFVRGDNAKNIAKIVYSRKQE